MRIWKGSTFEQYNRHTDIMPHHAKVLCNNLKTQQLLYQVDEQSETSKGQDAFSVFPLICKQRVWF